MRKTLVLLAAALPLSLTLAATAVSSAHAQAAPAPLPDTKKVAASTFVSTDDVTRAAKKPQGFGYDYTLAANLNVASNRDVVGQINGNSVLFGASALANVSYLRGPHEWLNTGSLAETWSKTPAIDEFIKSNDLLNLQTLYNYFLRDWTGPFTRLNLQTGILKTDRITAGAETYQQTGVGTTAFATDKLKLSDSFQPFTVNESVGWFFQPVRTEVFNTYARVGLGGRHTLADGARAIQDDKATAGVTEFTVLSDVHQAGAELFAGVDGKELDGRILYNLGLSALFPLLSNDNTDRSIAKLTRVALQGAVGMGIFSWLSVNYQLKLVRDVQLVDDVQITNSLLLSLQYTKASYTPNAAPSEADLAKAKIAALEAENAELSARASAAEARAAGFAPEAPAQLEPSAAPPSVAPQQPLAPAAPVPTP